MTNVFNINKEDMVYIIWDTSTKTLYYSYKHSLFYKNPDLKNASSLCCEKVIVNCPHIIYVNGQFIYKTDTEQYTYQPGLQITNILISPTIKKYIKESELQNYHYIAEIGCRYGSSSKWLLDNSSEKDLIHLYEKSKEYCQLIKQRLNKNNYSLFCGKAQRILPRIDIKYDLVFFDASHKKEEDTLILNELVKHIDENTLIIFDDYDMPEMTEMIDNFIENSSCLIRYCHNDNIITVRGRNYNNKIN